MQNSQKRYLAETYNCAHCSMKMSEDPVDVARVLYLDTQQNKGTEIGSTVAEVSCCRADFFHCGGGHLGWDKERMDKGTLGLGGHEKGAGVKTTRWTSASRTSATGCGVRGKTTAQGLSTPYSRRSLLPLQCHESDSTAMPVTLRLSFQLRSLLSSALISVRMTDLTLTS